MSDTMKTNHQYQINHEYSIRSGVLAALSPDISIKPNKYGEYEYSWNKSRISSETLEKVKQVDAMSDESPNEDVVGAELFSRIEGIKHDSILGYYLDLYVGHVTQGSYRANGTSGGIATWLLDELFRRKMIDGVIHIRHSDGDDGILFKYAISRSSKEIRTGAKSRYYPGELSDVLKEVRGKQGRYAIVGIPSIIMEVRLLQRVDPVYRERIKYTIGIFCGHQKSMRYADLFGWQCGIKPGQIRAIDFRKKVPKLQTRAKDQYVEIESKKGETIIRQVDTFRGMDWGWGTLKTHFSDYTDDAFNETADITLGDAWLPEYMRDKGGDNIIIVRNKEIAGLLKRGAREGNIAVDTVDKKMIIRSQSSMVRHMRNELSYRLYKKDKKGEWRPKKRVEAANELSFLRRRVQDLREIMPKVSHEKFEEAIRRDDIRYYHRAMQPYIVTYNLVYRLMALQKLGFRGALLKMKEARKQP